MAPVVDLIRHYQHNIEKYSGDENRVLKCIDKLYHLDVTVQHLQETGVGRTMNALRKEPGEVGQAARALVYKWKVMVAAEASDQEDDHNDSTPYNGNGKDSDDSTNQSRNRQDRYENSSSSKSRQRNQRPTNGDYSQGKRKYHSSEEEEHEPKKSKHSSSSEDDYKRKKVKSDHSESESQDSDSHSDSESEMSDSSVEETKVNHKIIKTEPSDKNKSSKHSHSNHVEHKRESSSVQRSQDATEKHSKRHSSETRQDSGKSTSKEKSHSSRDTISKDKESNSVKKYKSDHKPTEKEKRYKEEPKPSSKQSSSEKEKHRSSSQKTDSSDKHKIQSEKSVNKPEKQSSSSQKPDKEKHKSSSEKEFSNNKHKSRDSSSSKEKHSSSSKEKSKESSSSSKEKSSSHKSDKKHSSSSNDKSKSSDSKNKSEKVEERRSDKKSSHKSSSSSSHKSKSSSSKSKEDIPKINTEDSDDGIDCGSGASFADVLGMIVRPQKEKSKKKLTPVKDTISPNNLSADLSPAALLAPSAKLAPLPALEISALPEISPNYKPRPPPKFLPHFSDDDAMSIVISSKNQRTKVYSGNKVIGKVPSLYDMCVQILQEHTDALEYTGGVPYEILKPVVDKASPQQLFMLEHYNPYLMDDTDHLWQRHCEKHFRNKKRLEMETWREMYTRCQEEQEYRLKSLTANIRMTQEAKKAPIKQTKMAYVDSVVKPPRNIARKQALHGTAHSATASPAARVATLASTPNVLKGGAVRPINAAPGSASSFKPKKAPLMQKALQLMRGRKR